MRHPGPVLLAALLLVAGGCMTPTATSTDHFNRGVDAFLKDKKTAEKEFRAAIEENPSNAQAYNQLGRLYFDEGKYAEAEKNFEAAARLQPTNLDFLENLGKAAFMNKDNAKAILSFGQAMRLAPNVAAYPYFLGVVAQSEGKKDEALAYYHKALDIDPFFTQARLKVRNLESANLPVGAP